MRPITHVLLSGFGGIALGLAMVQVDKYMTRRLFSESQDEH